MSDAETFVRTVGSAAGWTVRDFAPIPLERAKVIIESDDIVLMSNQGQLDDCWVKLQDFLLSAAGGALGAIIEGTPITTEAVEEPPAKTTRARAKK